MRLRLSAKLSALAGCTILATALALGALAVHDIRQQAEARITSYRNELLTRHTERVRNLVEVAYGELDHRYRAWLQTRSATGAPDRSEREVQAAALADLKDLRYGDGNYFWVNHLDGHMLMHPYQTQLDGTDVNDFQDTDGVYLFREFRRVCLEQGQGLVAYTWPRPGSDVPVPKLSFVKLFSPWKWVVGSGIYVDDIEAAVAAERARVDRQVARAVWSSAGIAGGLFVLCTLLLVWVSRRFVTTPLRNARDLVANLPAGDLDHIEPLPEEPADEIGELLAAINGMVAAWQRVGEEQREQERFAEQLITCSAVAAFVLGPDHRVLLWNRACEELTGLRATDIVGSREAWRAFYPVPAPTLADLLIDGDLEGAAKRYLIFHRSDLSAEGHHAELWFENLGGHQRYLVFDAVPIRNSAGELIAVVETLQDIAELKRAEEKLARLVAAMEQAAETIVVTDVEGTITYANPAFETLTGFSREKAIGDSIHILRSRQYDGFHYQDMEAALRRGESWSGRLISRRLDGTLFDEETSVSPVYSPDGSLAGYVSIQRDISDEVALEKQLRQVKKMEAVGTISGGIAHEFNSLLNVILGFTELTLADLGEAGDAHVNLRRVLEAAGAGQELVRQLTAFSRQLDHSRLELGLGQVVRDAVEALRPSLHEGLVVEVETIPPSAKIRGDAPQLVQVVRNLVNNAAQAMEGTQGTVRISVDLAVIQADAPAPDTGPGPGRYWRVTVRDNGPGMTREILERIFDPFFTTREVGTGSGLGLSVAHGIVRGHGGVITAHSNPKQGSTFHLYFPALLGETAENSANCDSPRERGNILVVNGDLHEGRGISHILKELGYHPTLVSSRADALAAIRHSEDGFALAIVEEVLPKMSGKDVAATLREQCPGIPVLLGTGYEEEGPKTARNVVIAGYMHQPYSPESIAAAVRATLGESNPSSRLSVP